MAISTHVSKFRHLGAPGITKLSSISSAIAAAAVGVLVLFVVDFCGHFFNDGVEFLDLVLHCQHFVLCLDVGCAVGCCCAGAGKFLDVLAYLVAVVCYLVG